MMMEKILSMVQGEENPDNRKQFFRVPPPTLVGTTTSQDATYSIGLANKDLVLQ
jgi:hypothetical protein